MKSGKPRKQRRMLHQAPLHIRAHFMSAPLSSELRESYGFNSITVRVGDTVRVMRGDTKGFEGKVTRVDRRKMRIYIEGLTKEKSDGSTIHIPIHPSKVEIIRLNLDDKMRRRIIERKGAGKAKPEAEEAEEVKGVKEVEEAGEPVKEAEGA